MTDAAPIASSTRTSSLAPAYAAGGFVGFATASSSTAGGSGDGGLGDIFSFLRGSLTTFGHDLTRTHNLMDALNQAAQQLESRLVDFSFRLISNALFGSGKNDFGLVGSLFGLGGGGLSDFTQVQLAGAAGGLYAKGDVFPTGISAFSSRVVTRPTFFRFASGAGLMGEAGPEGILPLRRNSAGQLGVMASGGGGNTIVQVIDNAGVQKQTRKTKGPNGEEMVQVILDRVKEGYADGGFDDLNRSLYGFGRNGVPA